MAKKLISLFNLTRFKDYLNLAFEAVSEALEGKVSVDDIHEYTASEIDDLWDSIDE